MGSTCVSAEEDDLLTDDAAGVAPPRAWLVAGLVDLAPEGFIHWLLNRKYE
jgi:hypothetical protein